MADYEIRRVQSQGNTRNFTSNIVALPKKMCEKLSINKGDYIKMRLVGKTIIIEKIG
jgi:antitoxin component of MazEF toxin-antitoxin module